jgi:hypothetical protein
VGRDVERRRVGRGGSLCRTEGDGAEQERRGEGGEAGNAAGGGSSYGAGVERARASGEGEHRGILGVTGGKITLVTRVTAETR